MGRMGVAMKKTVIICDDCKKEFSCIGLGYSLTWERAKKQGWRNPNGYHGEHLCEACCQQAMKRGETLR